MATDNVPQQRRAEAFAACRSYLRTAAKHGKDMLDALTEPFTTGSWLLTTPGRGQRRCRDRLGGRHARSGPTAGANSSSCVRRREASSAANTNSAPGPLGRLVMPLILPSPLTSWDLNSCVASQHYDASDSSNQSSASGLLLYRCISWKPIER